MELRLTIQPVLPALTKGNSSKLFGLVCVILAPAPFVFTSLQQTSPCRLTPAHHRELLYRPAKTAAVDVFKYSSFSKVVGRFLPLSPQLWFFSLPRQFAIQFHHNYPFSASA